MGSLTLIATVQQKLSRRDVRLFAISLLLLVCLSTIALSQNNLPTPTADDQLGEQYLGSYHGGDIDSIGLTNGTLSLKFPFLSYPQRGKLHLGFSLMYNNQPQHFAQNTIQQKYSFYQWGYFPFQNPLPVEKGDVFVGWDEQVAGTFRGFNNVTSPPPTNNYFANYMLQLADGSEHTLANMGGFSQTNIPGSNDSQAVSDGPFETLDATAWQVLGPYTASSQQYGPMAFKPLSVIDPDGVMYGPGEEDPNGNYISNDGTTLTDSIGRPIPLPPTYKINQGNPAGCPTVNNVVPKFAVAWIVPTYGGGKATYTFCYGPVVINIPTNYFGSLQVLSGAGGGSTNKLTSILLPNGQQWQFTYSDTDGTNYNGSPVNFATLANVVLPTGGSISYKYTYGGSAACQNGGRWVSTRTVNDETGSHIWTYSYYNTYTVVTDPAGNDVVHTFGLINECQMYETQTQYYQGSRTSGTLLKTVNTTYTYATNVKNTQWGLANVVPTSVATVWANGQTATTTKQYDPSYGFKDYMGNTSPVPVIYGKAISETVNDYSGSALRTTNTQYLGLSNTNYLSNNIINPPYTVAIEDGTGKQQALTTYNYDQYNLAASDVTEHLYSPPAGQYPGNLTSVTKWVNSGGPNVTTTNYFYNTGEINQSVDTNGHTTTYTFASGAPLYGAYLTQVSTPPPNSFSTEYGYDANSGKVTSIIDPNNNQKTYKYDALWRATFAQYPDGGQVTATYNDTSSPVSVVRSQLIASNTYLQNETDVDGWARVTKTSLLSDPESPEYVSTTYDALGRKASVTNPTRGGNPNQEPTVGTTTYVYDALGRLCVEQPPDGTSVSSCPASQPAGDRFTVYSGNTTTVYDEAGHARETVTDALGRITQVFEAPYSLNYETDYSYDALSDLTGVTQKGSNSSNARTRSFAYDSLSRLISATNPESGNILYSYVTSGGSLCSGDPSDVCQKTAPAANQTGSGTTTTTYTYNDPLNRLTGITYSDGTGADVFVYDVSPQWGATLTNPVGHLVRASTNNANIGNVFSYDLMDRKSKVYNVVWSGGNVYTNYFTYNYNYDGSVASILYPSGALINYTLEASGSCGSGTCTSGRVAAITDTVNNINYMGGQTLAVSYAPPGELLTMTNGYCPTGCGSAPFSGFTVTNSYNKRLQPSGLSVNSTAVPSATIFSLGYNFNLGGDNGNVAGVTNNLDNSPYHPGVGSATYTYDALNRITTAQTTGSDCSTLPNTNGLTANWGESYTVDAWGNLTAATVTQCSAVPLSVTVNTSNQFASACYDSAGNLLTGNACGSPVYTYNGKSQLVSTAGYTYSYDAEGDRVIKANGSTGTIYARSAGSDTLYETDLSGNFRNEYIYFNGKILARRDAAGLEHYYFSDMLGSTSVIASAQNGLEVVEDYYPYGLSRLLLNNTPQNYQFTSKERDSESGLDDFGARFYSSYWGRFMSPDEPFYDGDIHDPQKLNLYSYVRNNPLNSTDPDGHRVEICDTNGQNCTSVSNDAYAQAQQQDQYNHAPTLNQLQKTEGESQNITDSNGNVVGTATRYNDENAPVEGINPEGEKFLAGYGMGAGIGRAFSAAWGTVAGWFGRGAAETVGATAGKATVQDILQGAVDEGGSRAQIFSKPGGFAQATKDFEALEGQSQNLGRVQVKDLPGGQGRAVLRNFSSDGRPTLEIQPAGGGYKSTAIRYNP